MLRKTKEINIYTRNFALIDDLNIQVYDVFPEFTFSTRNLNILCTEKTLDNKNLNILNN